jgi:hypothetical protein
MEHSEVISTTNTGGGSLNSADEEKAGITNIQTPRSRPGSSSSGKHHHAHKKPSDPDVLLDSLGLHDLDAETTERGVQELLRKHSSSIAASSGGGGITAPSLLPTLNERMSDDMVNDGFTKDLQFVAKTNKKSDDTGEGGSGTSPATKDLITLEEEADEEENADDNDER